MTNTSNDEYQTIIKQLVNHINHHIKGKEANLLSQFAERFFWVVGFELNYVLLMYL